MGSSDVQYMIGGPDMQKLEQYAKSVMAELRTVPGAVDVDSSLSSASRSTASRSIERRPPELGVSIADIGNTLRLLVAGDKVSDYTDQGEQYEVHVRCDGRRAQSLDKLRMVSVPSKNSGRSRWGRGAIRGGNRPCANQPAEPYPAGHDQCQYGSRHVASRLFWTPWTSPPGS